MLIGARRINGYMGLVIRYALLKTLAKYCGNNVSIHPMCYIDAGGEINIGNDVSIAHAVTILSTTHNFDNLELSIKDQGVRMKKTVIEDNVWCSAKAAILCGNTVHSGSVITAGAVVTRDVPRNSIVAGIPAHVIKER